MSNEERGNELTSSAWLDAKADKLRLDYLEAVVEDAKTHLFDNWQKHGSIRGAIDHAMKIEGATSSFLSSNDEGMHPSPLDQAQGWRLISGCIPVWLARLCRCSWDLAFG